MLRALSIPGPQYRPQDYLMHIAILRCCDHAGLIGPIAFVMQVLLRI